MQSALLLDAGRVAANLTVCISASQPGNGAHTLLFSLLSITYTQISTEAATTSPPGPQTAMSATCLPCPGPAAPPASAAPASCPSSLSGLGAGSGEWASLVPPCLLLILTQSLGRGAEAFR